MTSSVISFAYFAYFSNTNISGSNADICKQLTAFLFFHGILCDTPKKSRGKVLIIIPLKVGFYLKMKTLNFRKGQRTKERNRILVDLISKIWD